MKKLLLIPALIAGTFAMAEDYKFEISPMVGYNFAEGNLNIKDNGYPVFGLEIQANSADSKLSPEISFLYSQGVDYKTGDDTRIMRGAFNGVYTFDAMGILTPFAKAGVGYEKVNTEIYDNQSGLFLDAGAGVKVPFTDQLALKLEAIYMVKPNTNNSGFGDNNLVTMAGLTYSFGAQEQKPAPKSEPVAAAPVVVDGDDDNDGVLNSKDKCPNTPAGVAVDASGCPLDSDKDGVIDAKDKCPNTPIGTEVDADGCPLDSDKDGVIDANDKCKNTPLGDTVNSDGCPPRMNLFINFENNSAKLKEESQAPIDEYAEFLNTNKNYSSKIVGYTDITGTKAYNKQLSLKRAVVVQKALMEKGVDAKQLSVLGRGIENPVASNKTAEGRAQNRRIEAELIRH